MKTDPPPPEDRERKRRSLKALVFRIYAVWVPMSFTLLTLVNALASDVSITAYMSIAWPVWWIGLLVQVKD